MAKFGDFSVWTERPQFSRQCPVEEDTPFRACVQCLKLAYSRPACATGDGILLADSCGYRAEFALRVTLVDDHDTSGTSMGLVPSVGRMDRRRVPAGFGPRSGWGKTLNLAKVVHGSGHRLHPHLRQSADQGSVATAGEQGDQIFLGTREFPARTTALSFYRLSRSCHSLCAWGHQKMGADRSQNSAGPGEGGVHGWSHDPERPDIGCSGLSTRDGCHVCGQECGKPLAHDLRAAPRSGTEAARQAGHESGTSRLLCGRTGATSNLRPQRCSRLFNASDRALFLGINRLRDGSVFAEPDLVLAPTNCLALAVFGEVRHPGTFAAFCPQGCHNDSRKLLLEGKSPDRLAVNSMPRSHESRIFWRRSSGHSVDDAALPRKASIGQPFNLGRTDSREDPKELVMPPSGNHSPRLARRSNQGQTAVSGRTIAPRPTGRPLQTCIAVYTTAPAPRQCRTDANAWERRGPA